MKVLQINTSVNTTSTGRITEEIGEVLQRNGFESYIAYQKAGPVGSNSKLIRVGNNFDFYSHALQTRLFDRHGFGSKKATRNFISHVREINPDVIGLHNLHGYYLNVEVLFNFMKKVQKPVIWTFHDCWPFTGHCSHFEYVSCERWKTECYECPLSDKYPASWFLDNSTGNFRRKRKLFNGLQNLTIVTPSRWLATNVKQSFLSAYPVEVIYNGIDLEKFKPVDPQKVISKYSLHEKKILLGVASVWDRIKGFDYFLELSKRLDNNFSIIIIGLPEEKIKTLPSNIIGIQRTEDINELVSFYSAADVFVNPTMVDNFPTTNLEALACGTPVITFSTGGSPEAIDRNTGMVVQKGDVDALQLSIQTLLEHDGSRYRQNCRQRALELFNKDDRFRDYLNLYTSVLQEKNQKTFHA